MEPIKQPELQPQPVASEQITPADAPVPQAAAAPAPVSLPQLPADQPQQAPTAAPLDNPTEAEDVDVIEKEWVDKAEKIIKDTEHDPYQEEEKVEDLQIDYMKKRFGKDINKSQ